MFVPRKHRIIERETSTYVKHCQGEIDINQSVSNNAADVQSYIDVDVSSEEEV